MILDDSFIQSGIRFMSASGTGYLRFAAYANHPFVKAYGRISGDTFLFALPPFCIYIIPTFEKSQVQSDFFRRIGCIDND
jgi:hypothetical protein